MDTTRINHNNSGHKYRIAVDIAKEGSHIWDLTPYFKGRVGDNNFGLQVTWYYQGQLMNVVGMKPYIEGLVGQYSFGKNGEIDMDPDAVPVRYDGSPDDCEEAGKATFYFPSQMFPKEGIFKGFIGVKDDRDGSKNPQISGVTIWFKVLPGIAQMGHACDVYISDLDKALQNFKVKLDQHDKDYQTQLQQVIDDARNAYESETKNAHDSLDALKSQIQANRDEQANLTNRLAGTEQQIATHDVVTRPEFYQLSNQLTQQVSQMRQSGLEFFNDVTALKAAYPQGANKLCVTLNDSHQWIYDYANAEWNNAGAFNYGTIDPNLQSAFYRNGLDNLVPNSSFDTLDSWQTYCANDIKPNITIRDGVKKDNSNIVRVIGHWDNEHPDLSYTWTLSPIFSIDSSKPLSYGALVNFNSLIPDSGGEAQLQTIFFNDANTRVGWDSTLIVPNKNDQLHSLFKENILPRGATKAQFAFGIQGPGHLDITQPFIYEGKKISYSLGKFSEAITSNSSNLLIANSILDFTYSDKHISVDDQVNCKGQPTLKLSNDDPNFKDYIIANSNNIAIEKNQYYKITIPAKVTADYSKDTSVFLSVYQLDNRLNQVTYNNFSLTNSIDMEDHTFVFKTLDNSAYINIKVSIKGIADVNAGNISIEKYAAKNVFYTTPSFLYAKDNHVQLNNGFLNIKGTTEGEFVNTWTTKLPINSKLKKIAFDLESEVSLLSNTAKAYLTCIMFDKDGKRVDYQDLILDSAKTINHFELPIIDDAVEIETNFATYGPADFLIKRLKCSLGVDADLSALAASQKYKYNPLTNWPVYNWIFPSGDQGEVVRDDEYSYESHPTLKIVTSGKQLSDWTFAQIPRFSKGKINALNLKLVYQARFDSKQGGAYLTIREQDSKGNVTTSNNIELDSSDSWITKEINNYMLNSKTETIQFMLSVNGNGFLRVGELLWIENSDTELDENPRLDLPKFTIDAPSSKISRSWTTSTFKYQDKGRTLSGYVQFGIQGNSSAGYDKKNLKLKFYKDAECKNKLKWKPKSNWTSNFKFNAKANWIDATQSRNLVNAQIFEKATEITPIANNDVSVHLLNTQSLGQMEGFPIEIVMADGYYGLFTFNTKKDDKTFGMDDKNPEHECVTNNNSFNGFKPNQTWDSANYGTEIHDSPSDELKTNMSSLINFINTASDDDFKAKISNYIDVYSVINTYLYGLLSEEWDFQNKSQLLLTWNSGKYFFMIPYDLDSTWGLHWDGSHLNYDEEAKYFAFTENSSFVSMTNINNLMARIVKLFKPEIKLQYQKLRTSVWRNDQIVGAFKQFINAIPEKAYEHEQERWPNIPSKEITDFAQIQQSVIARGNAMDSFMEHFADSQSASPAPQPTTPQAQPTESKQ